MTREQIEAVALPQGVREGEAFAPPDSPTVGSLANSFTAENVEDILRRLAESVERQPNLASLAKILGLTYFVGSVGDMADAAFPHDSKRPLALVVFSVNLEGGEGRVCGCSAPTTPSLNTTKWSSTTIFVRATVTGRYAFFVI